MSISRQSPILNETKETEGSCDGCVTPARFSSIKEEYDSLRKAIGIVDYSYNGTFRLKGSAALDVLNRVTLADISRLPINRMLSSFMLNPDGSVLCDVYVVNQGDSYLLLSEGAEPSQVLEVVKEECQPLAGSVALTDLTHEVALLGLDGPFAWELLKELIGIKILGIRYLAVMADQSIDQTLLTLMRAGKTGEFGYLLQLDAKDAPMVWRRLLDAGKDFDLKPCGYEAVDLCKLENRFISMKREGRLAENALELNCRIMVSHEKDNYIGYDAIKKALDSGIQRRLVGLTIDWPAGPSSESLPPVSSEIQYQGVRIGNLANAGFSYTLAKHIGVGFLNIAYAYVGLDYTLKANGTNCPIRTVSAPFIINRSLTIRPQEDSYKKATP